MDYGLNYGYYQPNMFYPTMDFSNMQNFMGYYPQYYTNPSVFMPQTTAQVTSQQQVAQQQTQAKEEPKEKKELFALNGDGSYKNLKVIEATPEKIEEYKKAYKKDATTKTILSVGTLITATALAIFLGPKAFSKLKDGNFFKSLFASGDKFEDIFMNGLLIGAFPGAIAHATIQNSIGNGLEEKIFGEKAAVQK